MNKKLILIDLDGTALKNFTELHEKTIEYVAKVRELGHIVCICTGRSYAMSELYYEQLNLDTPIANYNGAHVHHPKDKKFPLFLKAINIDLANRLLKQIKPISNKIVSENMGTLYATNKTIMTDFYESCNRSAFITYIAENHEFNHEIQTMLISYDSTDHLKDLVKILDEFKDEIHYHFWNEDKCIEVNNSKINKGIALHYLKDYFNIAIEDTIALGDGDNDIQLLKEAGLGICMNNGFEKTKEVADIVSEYSNKDGAVGIFLKDYFKL